MVDGSVQPTRVRGEARSRILAAARELFTQNGFDGTTVRGVAQRANASEALVYRYFQSKQKLSDDAVTDVYRSYIAEFIKHWGVEAGLSNEQVVANYVRGLYGVVVENRDLFFALVVAGRFGHPGADSGLALAAELRRLAGVVTAEARERGIEHVDIEMARAKTSSDPMRRGRPRSNRSASPSRRAGAMSCKTRLALKSSRETGDQS
jgi:AcrR family transcriptional regulator